MQISFNDDYESNSPDYMKKGNKIHIKEKNKGKFTDYCGGKVTDECILKGKNSSNPTIRKRATFAANARVWKHQGGGTASIIGQGIAAVGSAVPQALANAELMNKLRLVLTKQEDLLRLLNAMQVNASASGVEVTPELQLMLEGERLVVNKMINAPISKPSQTVNATLYKKVFLNQTPKVEVPELIKMEPVNGLDINLKDMPLNGAIKVPPINIPTQRKGGILKGRRGLFVNYEAADEIDPDYISVDDYNPTLDYLKYAGLSNTTKEELLKKKEETTTSWWNTVKSPVIASPVELSVEIPSKEAEKAAVTGDISKMKFKLNGEEYSLSKALKTLNDNDATAIKHYCTRAVFNAMRGITDPEAPSGVADPRAAYKVLKDSGWKDVAFDDNYVPQAGDVWTYYLNKDKMHTSMYDGTQWISYDKEGKQPWLSKSRDGRGHILRGAYMAKKGGILKMENGDLFVDYESADPTEPSKITVKKDPPSYMFPWMNNKTTLSTSTQSTNSYLKTPWYNEVVAPQLKQNSEASIELPEVEVVASAKTTDKQTGKTFTGNQSDFAKMAYSTYKSAGLTHNQALLMAAQDAIESSWGKSELSLKYHNYGGIKGSDVSYNSKECKDGKCYKSNQSFKKFNSYDEYALYKVGLLKGSRYNAFIDDNINNIASRIKAGGYASSPTYVKDLLNQVKSIEKRL